MKIAFVLFFTCVIILLTENNLHAQGMINDGAAIIITAGANVYIDGDAMGKYTNQTNAGSDGKIDLDGNMYVEGDWVNNATGNNVFINNAAAPWGTVYLNGAVASNITGTGMTEFENLYIQVASRTLQITDCEVNNILTVDNAGLILNQKKFIIDNNSAAGIAAAGTGHVRSENTAAPFGEIQWNIGSSTGSSYLIPFATAAPALIPFTFQPTAGTTGNLVIATYPTSAANLPFPPTVTHVQNYFTGANNSAMTVDRFWEILVPGALAAANVNFRCTAAEAVGIANPRAQRWIPAALAWEYPLQGTQVTAVTGTDVTGMSGQSTWWTLADITSPLPVELVSFHADCRNKIIELSWSTATETENKFFTVEKSRDGFNFEFLTSIKGAGTSTSMHSYFAEDKSPFAGINYYRLKQTDFNGMETIISSVERINSCASPAVFTASLVNNNGTIHLIANATADENFMLSVFDVAGRQVYSKPVFMKEGFNELFINDAHLSNSLYLVRMEGTMNYFSGKVVFSAK